MESLFGGLLQLIEAVRISEETRLALVGAGGKTTAMFRLAEQWVAEKGTAILLSTSTHLAETELDRADLHVVIQDLKDFDRLTADPPQGVIVVSGPLLENSKVAGLSEEHLEILHIFGQQHNLPLIIEADGSAQHPLKAPADHEPVIPSFVDQVIVVVGISAVGKPLNTNWVHRVEEFSHISGLDRGDQITVESIAKMLLSDSGGLKGIPAQARRGVLINQCDTPALAGVAKSSAKKLLNEYQQIMIASLEPHGSQEVISNRYSIAGVVLAAGGSDRLGQPKQLLDWGGQPFVRVVAQTALMAGLSPVFVVVGAFADQVETALEGLDVVIVPNSQWEEGQSTSLKAGIDRLSPKIQAAVLLLADQPQIPPPLIEALIEEHAVKNVPIVAPMIDNHRANPVLFDRLTFADLSSISGDTGGRKIFSHFRVHYVPWLDPRVGMDVDTPDDYQQLLDAWRIS
jgi:molybdenum cofactor cytidylyltransferase